jgi:hypothetical protein
LIHIIFIAALFSQNPGNAGQVSLFPLKALITLSPNHPGITIVESATNYDEIVIRHHHHCCRIPTHHISFDEVCQVHKRHCPIALSAH